MWLPEPEPAAEQPHGPTWRNLFDHWDLIEADLLERFSVDMWQPGAWLMPWPRLQQLVVQLLATPPGKAVTATEAGITSIDVPQTRIQHQLLRG